MKMAYQYALCQSIYSINEVPKIWEYPVSLLLHVRATDQVEPLIFLGPAPQNKSFEELVPGKEY